MAAALVYEKYPWMTNDQIRQTLFTTTDKTELTEDPDTLSEAKLRKCYSNFQTLLMVGEC